MANRVSDKLTPIADNIYVCRCKKDHSDMLTQKHSRTIFAINLHVFHFFPSRSGSAADTQAISAYVEHYLRLHTLEKGKLADVSTAATIVRKLCYENRNALLVREF